MIDLLIPIAPKPAAAGSYILGSVGGPPLPFITYYISYSISIFLLK